MTQEPASFKRSRGVRFAPMAGLLVSAVVMTRGSQDWLLTLIGAAIFVVAAVAVWWAWKVPLATFERTLLVWKEVPQRSSVEIDTEQLKRWRYSEEVNSLEMELRDGQLTTLNLNAMSPEDVPPYRGLFPSPPLFDRMPTYRTQGKRSLNFLSAPMLGRPTCKGSANAGLPPNRAREASSGAIMGWCI